MDLLLAHQNIDVNYANAQHITPLMEASRTGFLAGARALLRKPEIEVNKDTRDGKTAIFVACEDDKSEVVELLLRCPETDVTLRDRSFKSALDIVKENDSPLEYMFYNRSRLMGKGHTCCSKHSKKGLQIACMDGNEKIVRMFLACPGIDVNNGYQSGITPLYITSRNNNSQIVKILLNVEHLDVNKIVNGENSLLIAAEKGYWEVVKLLLSHPSIDANVDKRGNQGSALFIASSKGFSEIVRLLLLKPQIYVNKQYGPQSNTPLITSSENRNLGALQLLLRCPKTDIKMTDVFGNTASDLGTPAIVEEIEGRDLSLKKGHTCCINGNKILHRAAKSGDGKAIRGLALCPSTNINHLDEKGRTPLYMTSWLGHVNATKELLALEDIDVNKGRRLDGKSPLSIASEKGHFKIIMLIISHIAVDANIGWINDSWAFPIHDLTFEMDTMNEGNGLAGNTLATHNGGDQFIYLKKLKGFDINHIIWLKHSRAIKTNT